MKPPIGITSSHSSLRLWMQSNRDQIQKEMDAVSRPDWDGITALVDRIGLRAKNGNPFSKGAVRLTWVRVSKMPLPPQKSARTEAPAPQIQPQPASYVSADQPIDAAAKRERLRIMTEKRSIK